MKIVSGEIIFPWLGSLTVSGILIFSHNQVSAQVTPDNTLGDESSVVNTRDANSESIDGGAVRGQNLFHSFQEFNVGEDRGVYFTNPDAITNIFSRVTGDNVSNILGTLGVDGAANLYLINPNGIVFGEGASLDVQGSFTATTADGIEFGEQGFFSVSDPESPNLLTINPSAYLFNQAAPGAIANSSKTAADLSPATSFDDSFFGLRVPDGQSLLLLGGDIKTDGGGLVASGGRIELGAIAGGGVVGLNANGSLNIPDGISRGDVSLTNGAGFLVAGDGGGDIAIAAKDISLDSASTINAGIYNNLGSPNAQAGDLIINATDNITVDNSRIANEVNLETVGNAGDIFINANSLKVLNGSQIGSPTFGRGDGGNVTVRASNIKLAGTSSDGLLTSGLFTTVAGSQAQGNGGNLTINTDNLSLSDSSQISASTFGKGDAGNVKINVTNNIALDNESTISSNIEQGAVGNGGQIEIDTNTLDLTNGGQVLTIVREAGNNLLAGQGNAGNIAINVNDTLTLNGASEDGQFSSAIYSDLNTGAKGKAGNLEIDAKNLVVQDGGQISSSTFGQGSAGNIDIQAENLVVEDSGEVTSSTFGQGNSGNIAITADNSISLDASSYILNNVQDINAVGNAGKIDITTGSLSATNGSQINSFTRGRGNAGDITIQATNEVTFDGVDNQEFFSSAFSNVDAGAVGNGGEINITARSLSLINGGQLEASVFGKTDKLSGGKGQGGNININVNDTLIIADGNLPGIFANLGTDAVGSAGNIDIQAGNLVVKDSGSISSGTLGQGNAGKIDITTGSLMNAGFINSSTLDQGNAGDITIKATDLVTFDGFNSNNAAVFSSVGLDAIGNGGNIDIQAGNLIIRDSAFITSSTLGQGDSGDIIITTGSLSATNSGIISSDTFSKGNAGNISIATGSLSAINAGVISSSTLGQGNAGDVTIQATDTVTFDGFNDNFNSSALSSVGAGALGDGGNIKLTASSLFLTNGGQLEASTFGEGDSGNIFITADNVISLDTSSYIVNNVQSIDAVGNAGTIDIITNSLFATNGSQINSFSRGGGDAGDITIQATDTVTFDGFDSDNNYSALVSSVEAGGEGDGGNIKITTPSLSLTNGGQLNVSVREPLETLSGGKGQGGNIDIQAGNLIIRDGGLITSSTSGQGNSGNISITADNVISLDASSYIINNVQDINAIGDAGKIDITTGSLSVTNGSQINSFTRGQGNAGNITIQAIDAVTFDGFDREGLPSSLNTTVEDGAVGDGGNISLTAGNIRLRNDSDISTYVFNGTGDGGDISITADSVIAFDDSDIFAFAADGKGGNINLDTPAFFAENFTLNSLTSNPDTLDLNSRADVNATGAVSGSVSIPDVNFIQNSLNNLPGNSINTDELVANSCVVPVGDRQQGKFIITGGQSLPVRPGDGIPSKYPTGEVRNIPENNHSSWQSGDPIVEPQGAYRLANGKLVLSRQCSP